MPTEQERLKELHSYEVLDSTPDRFLDNLTSLAAAICGAPIALISLVDDKRQWFLSRFGLDTPETTREVSFCHYAIQQDLLFVVEDAKADPFFKDFELVNNHIHIGFYAGMPLKTPRGLNIGTLCVIDRKSKSLDAVQRKSLLVLSHAVMNYLIHRSAKKAAEKQYEEFNRFFSMGLELICTATEDGYFKMLNPVWKSELGYELEELREQPFLNLVHPDDRDSTVAAMQKLSQSADKLELFRNRYKHKNGNYVWLSWNAMKDDGNRLIYATARNISSILQLEEQIEMDRLLSKKQDEEKIMQFSKLTSAISHEIQNPLNMIIGFSEIGIETIDEIFSSRIEKESSTNLEIMKTVLEKVSTHAKHMSELVKVMSEISVPGYEHQDLQSQNETQSLSVNRVLRESEKVALKTMQNSFPEFQCEVKYDLDPVNPRASLPVGVLSRALVNIIINAFESLQHKKSYDPSFSPMVTIKTKSVNQGTNIVISNNGPGIPNTDRQKIFNPLFSSKSTGKNKGLGLTVSYCLLKKHRAELHLESGDEGNTTFRVHLPE